MIGFGKGIFSRSEPLFSNPNPCFNSVGRATRENFLFKINTKKSWLWEIIKLNFLDSFFLIKKKIIKFSGYKNKKIIKKVFSKINPFFLFVYEIIKKYKINNFNLKSGIKYGGNHLVYQKKNENDLHSHSIGILHIENSVFYENFCKICSLENYKEWKNVQNRVRLAQQVSKKIFFIDLKKKKKSEEGEGRKKKWILLELRFERWNSF